MSGPFDDLLDGIVPQEEEEQRAPPDLPTTQQGLPIVFWIPVVCPYCGMHGQAVKIHKTRGLERYHECRECLGRFVSIAKIPQRGQEGA